LEEGGETHDVDRPDVLEVQGEGGREVGEIVRNFGTDLAGGLTREGVRHPDRCLADTQGYRH
jgi:hypothetical protein